ncbi:MAG: carboxypeptidase regulatory-like domain-containing protein, partial [Janthinobacterium lividum]
MTSNRFLLPAVLFSIAAAPLMAQNNATRGGIGGAVTDPSGAVIPNASVLLEGPQGKVNSNTDSSGSFNVTGLTPGFYKITVTAAGFSTYVSERNEVVIDHSSNINVKLTVGAGDTTVTVEGGVVQIDTTDTSINTSVTDTFYNAVPLQRNVASAFYVAPGVVVGTPGSAGTTNAGPGTSNPSIGGASGLENLYIADGVTITDQAFGGLGVYNVNYGSLGSGINLAFIKEVDVKTGAFEPKYGRGDGGIVEILTKSGSNAVHGAISTYMTPGVFYAARYQPYQFGYIAASP